MWGVTQPSITLQHHISNYPQILLKVKKLLGILETVLSTEAANFNCIFEIKDALDML